MPKYFNKTAWKTKAVSWPENVSVITNLQSTFYLNYLMIYSIIHAISYIIKIFLKYYKYINIVLILSDFIVNSF